MAILKGCALVYFQMEFLESEFEVFFHLGDDSLI